MLIVHSPDFFPENSLTFFVKRFLAAIWHWCIDAMFFNLSLLLSIPLTLLYIFFNLVLINSTMANDTSLMCSLLTGVILKGLTLQIFGFDICACKTMFCCRFVYGLILWTGLKDGL